MKKVFWGILILIISSSVSFAHEFKNFKLTGDFEKNNLSRRDAEGLSPMESKVKSFLKQYGGLALDRIVREMIEYNHEFKLGQFNGPSVNWESGIDGELGIQISRNVDPIAGSDKWNVFDSLTVNIGAKAFLKKLREEGSILITDAKLDLFAGVVFSRTYSHNHTANSYKDGLKKKFDRLLLGFYRFMWVNFLEVEKGEVISKTDRISVGVELAANTPSYYFLSGYGNLTVAFSRLNTISYHSPTDELRRDSEDVLRVSRTVTKMVGTNVQIGLQADFYELMRITLLGMEYEISYAKDQSTHLSFNNIDIVDIRTNKYLKDAVQAVNKGGNPLKFPELKKYITTNEVGSRFSQQLNTFALVWGKHVGTSEDKLSFETNEGNYYFYRHNDEQANVKKSLWNWLFDSRRLSAYSKREIKNMTFEVAADSGEKTFSNLEVEDPSKVSFSLSKEYQIKKNKKRYLKQASAIIKEFTSIDGGIVQGIEDGELKAPFALNLHAQIGKDGITHLMFKNADSLREDFTLICTGKYSLSNKKLKRKARKCVSLLAKLYVDAFKEYASGTKIQMKNFKIFMQYVSKKMKSFQHLKMLFGNENVYLYGTIAAITNDSMPFKTHFSEGLFQGHGIIQDFARNIR